MKVVKIMAVLASLLFCLPAMAQQTKPCEELKSEIDAKMREKGVQNYTLEIVANDEVGNKTVVGSCNGGKNKIVYTRGR
jgi:outer membrane lipoprotein-sorting protein